MRKILLLVLVFFVICSQSYAKEVTADKIVATVEGQPITAYELTNLAGFYNTKNSSILINRVVDDYVIAYYAKKLGIVVSDDDVDKFIENIAKRNNMDVNQFLDSVQNSGVDLDYYKKGIKLNLYRRKFASRMFASSVNISKKDMSRYYSLHKDEIKTNPVLIMSIIAVKNKKLAGNIYSQLKNGANFDLLKSRFSMDKDKSKSIPLSAFNKGIQNELTGLKKGGISSIIEANGAFYIIKLLNKIDYKNDLNSVSNEIKRILFMRKVNSKIASWLKMVKSRTNIEIFE